MKITILPLNFIDYSIQLANALSEHGEVQLFIRDKTTKEIEDLIDKRVRIIHYRERRNRNLKNIFMVMDVVKQIKKFNPDIIHVQGGNPWFSQTYRFLRKYPIIITIHDPIRHRGEEKKHAGLTRRANRRYSNHFIVHGSKLKSILIKEYQLSGDIISVIPHGGQEIFLRWYDNSVTEVKNTVLYFGRIEKYKGVEYLIKSEPLVSKEVPDVKFIIAGRGKLLESIKNQISDPSKFTILNYFIPYPEIASLFQKSSLVILPYIDGSQSGIVPMAYAFKKPVIVTDVGSIPEVVENGVTGLIVPPKDTQNLAHAIITLLKDNNLRNEMGNKAYEKMKRELSWDIIAKKTLEAYASAMKAKVN